MVFLDRSQHLLLTLDGGGDTGHHEGEGGNARHKEWLNHAHVPYPSDHSMMLELPEIYQII